MENALSAYLARSAEVLWQIVDAVGVPARLASVNRDTVFGVALWHVGGEVEVQELVVKKPPIRNGGDKRRTHGS